MSTDVEFDVYPERLFDETWGSERWGYPIRARRVGGRLYLFGQPGYDISQSVCLPRGELLEGLTDAEPFGSVDKELLVRLGFGVMVGEVLVPFHPSGLPEWTCLRAYLLELCGVEKENLPYLSCGDIMVILRREAGAHGVAVSMSGEARSLPPDKHRRYERPMSKREIGIALGLNPDNRKIAEKVDSMLDSWGGQLHKVNRTNYLIPLDVLPTHFMERFRRYVKDFHGVDL